METSNFVSAGATSEFGKGTCGGSKAFKRTSAFALHMSAYDPKRTLRGKPFTSYSRSAMPDGKRTVDRNFYNHLPEMRASSDRTYAYGRLSVLL